MGDMQKGELGALNQKKIVCPLQDNTTTIKLSLSSSHFHDKPIYIKKRNKLCFTRDASRRLVTDETVPLGIPDGIGI